MVKGEKREDKWSIGQKRRKRRVREQGKRGTNKREERRRMGMGR